MTPAEEATFVRLWQAGVETATIAQQFGIPKGTVQSRAHRLQQQDKIPPRPKGGAYPRQKAQARQEFPVPVQRPVQKHDTGAVQTFDTRPVQTFDTRPVQRLDRLEEDVQGLRHLVQALMNRFDHPLVQTPVQITALPAYPKGKAVRWNLWILDAIRNEITTLAAERDVSPSQLVQEFLWQALQEDKKHGQ